MIKECPVIINNDAVSVVRFDGIDIQFPPVGKNVKSVNVEFNDGKYAIVIDAKIDKPSASVKDKPKAEKASKAVETDKKQKKTITKKRETVVE